MLDQSRLDGYLAANGNRFVSELAALVRYPSVSAQPQHASGLNDCTRALAGLMRLAGLKNVGVVETPRHPVVIGYWLHAPDRPPILIYGHDDVQLAAMDDGWSSPSFTPVIGNQSLHGRGACDHKGQFFAHLKAIECWLKTQQRLPINVLCLFEGEEEIGSPNLLPVLSGRLEETNVDVAVVSDTTMPGPDQPAITESLRGGLSVELEMRREGNDLHSGLFGGAVRNPLHVMFDLLADLPDGWGRIAIAEFYRDVRIVEKTSAQDAIRLGQSDQHILKAAGTVTGWGEVGYSALARTTIRPSLSVTGINGGYEGPGVKAVIPSACRAKLNFRLVPDQDPRSIDRMFRKHVAKVVPNGMQARVTSLLGARPITVPRDRPFMLAAVRALQSGFGTMPTFVRCGGTIPIAPLLQDEFGIPTPLMGFALPDAGLHGPDEKMHLPTFFKAIKSSAALLVSLAVGPGHSKTEGRRAEWATAP
jgi:acetylornithine deacetylase/succinyl-diaminopimelate desuccinylase-like protein